MTTPQLRHYQLDVVNKTYEAWQRVNNVLVQMATGAGKTVTFCHIISQHVGHSVAIAHRTELVSQMSLTLARYGIRHRVIASAATCRTISALHMAEIGKDYTNPHSKVVVASVDTLVNLKPDDPMFKQTTLVVIDESHHTLRENKWGRAVDMFNAGTKTLGVSATPIRSDRKGLGSQADGIVDEMIIGVPMRWLIDNGFLTEYRIFAPPCDVDVSHVDISKATGDYNLVQLRKEIHKSRSLVGDIVSHYKRLAMGKLGITFVVDIEEAARVAQEYRDNGVPAEVISAKTPPLLRSNIMKRFKARQLLQLVNVDILGEGVDVPAVEVVSMARHTASFGLFTQQFGRALRPLDGKSHAIIIDHVSNVIRHGLPDAHREWSLDRGERRSRGTPNDVIPVRICMNPICMAVYERIHKSCPFCGHVPVPADRSAPDMVDGDLTELDPAMLRQLRGEIARIDGDAVIPRGVQPYVAQSIRNRHTERQEAQTVLRERIALWAGYQRHLGRDDPEVYRRFYFKFGTDIATAQTLSVREAEELTARISDILLVDNVVNMNYSESSNNETEV
jgi:superfamily II DNA or RNA helicase